jgi:capsular polysaccharide transport system permease protein
MTAIDVPPTLGSGLAARFRIIHALLVREVRSRSPQSRFGYALDLAQPCMQLAMMYAVFWGIGRKPDFGNNLFIFLVSGILPYFLFTHTVSRVMGTVPRIRGMRPLGVIMPMDIAITLTIFELIAITNLGVLSLTVAAIFGVHDVLPHDYMQIIIATVLVGLTGLGVGLTNSYLVELYSPYRLIWAVASRSLIFFSNLFYVVDFFPPVLRNILWWNPLLHGVIWFRVGMFQNYPTLTFSPWYLIAWCIGSVLVGLVLERVVPPDRL